MPSPSTSPSAAPAAPATTALDEPRAALGLWLAAIAVTSTMIGVEWDIAWHRSIGRDTFWSPPHVAIYLGGVLAGLASARLILGATFGRLPRAATVRVWGFQGPLGAFVAAWGGIAMIASAPFDDWWHNAYGLDVRILSPPHTVLALGIFATAVGALLLAAGRRNRAPGDAGPRRLVVYLGGLIVALVMTFLLELTSRTELHSARAYRALAWTAPALLVGLGRSAGARFGATAVAGVYTVVWLGLLWLFPLVPATPRLGPVYFPVHGLVPPGFPILLVVPALAVDLLAPKLDGRPLWLRALALGTTVYALLWLVEWPMASLLMSPLADNALLGGIYHDYYAHPSWPEFHHAFYPLEATRGEFALVAATGVAAAVGSALLGLGAQALFGRVRR
jgi:hypothetical protein